MKKFFHWLLGLLLIIFVLFFSHSYILEGLAKFLIVEAPLEQADVIVVLSGDSNGERLKEAIKLFKQGYSSKIIISGGPLILGLTHAGWLKKQAVALGLPEQAVLIEDRSESTLENAKFCLPLVKKAKFKSIILVTSPTHTRRSWRVFTKVFGPENIKIITRPAGNSRFRLQKWWLRHEDTQRVAREYSSLLFYFLKGY